MKSITLSQIDDLFVANPDVTSNRSRRNLIQKNAPFEITKDQAGRLLAMWINYRA